ncbi:MAG: MCE family protein [Acidobacteria bacterium]|nr:MCE family protein [Acidobacteriota bacterium]
MPQSKTSRLSELRVGLLVLLALAILVLVIFAVSGDLKVPGFGKTTVVRTEMPSVDGLRKGAEVRLSGKKIGSVREINFSRTIPADAKAASEAGNIEIVMDIDGTLDGRPAIERIRSDSVATLKTAGVLGDNVIDITPGTLSGKPISNGDKINSQAQKSVGDILNAAQTAVSNLNVISDDIKAMTGDLRKGKGTAGRFLTDEQFYVNLNDTILKAQSLISAIKEGDGTASKFINDPQLYTQVSETVAQLRNISETLNNQLNKGEGTLGKFVKDPELYNRANDLVAKADKISARLDGLMARVENGEGNLGKLFKDEKLYADARDTVEMLKGITTRLEKGEGTAGLLLKDEKLYNNVNTLSAEITKLIYDFRQNPKKYLSVKVTIF